MNVEIKIMNKSKIINYLIIYSYQILGVSLTQTQIVREFMMNEVNNEVWNNFGSFIMQELKDNEL